MPIVNSKELFKKAQAGHYAIGAFNVENMEMAQAVLQAGEELNSPIILQTTPSTLKYAKPETYAALIRSLAADLDIPVVIHLDHGESFESCCRALHANYTSLMIDGSKLSYEENIAVSKRVVEMADSCNISVEAELGTVGGKEDSHAVKEKDALYTNPDQALEFVERTGIHSLAIAIGTAHGFYKGTPKLDFERLDEIVAKVNVPLVLHGASGVPDDDIRRTIRAGICKVNFATELRWHYTRGCRSVLADEEVFDPKKFGTVGRNFVKDFVKEKILVCGCNNRA